MARDFMVALVTASGMEEAEKIARTLVEEKLAACVNVIDGCTSIYVWKGDMVRDSEAMLVVKTRQELFERLEKRVSTLHSYEVPEIIAFSLEKIATPYRRFLEENLEN